MTTMTRMTTVNQKNLKNNKMGGTDVPPIKLKMNTVNYQKKLDSIIASLGDKRPTLLLHSCCAPCSSYCLEYLSRYFDITVLYYNPNISPQSEFVKRAEEQRRFIGEFPLARDVKLIVDNYDPEEAQRMLRREASVALYAIVCVLSAPQNMPLLMDLTGSVPRYR